MPWLVTHECLCEKLVSTQSLAVNGTGRDRRMLNESNIIRGVWVSDAARNNLHFK